MKQNQQQLDTLLKTMSEYKPIEPSPFLYARIKHKIAEKIEEKEGLSRQLVWKIAAVLVVLIGINVSALYTYFNESIKETASVVEEVELLVDNNDYDTNY